MQQRIVVALLALSGLHLAASFSFNVTHRFQENHVKKFMAEMIAAQSAVLVHTFETLNNLSSECEVKINDSLAACTACSQSKCSGVAPPNPNIGTQIRGFLVIAGDKISEPFVYVGKAIESFTQDAAVQMQAGMSLVAGLFTEHVWNNVKGVWGNVESALNSAKTNLGSDITKLIFNAGNSLSSFGNSISSGIKTAINKMGQFFGNVGDFFTGIFSGRRRRRRSTSAAITVINPSLDANTVTCYQNSCFNECGFLLEATVEKQTARACGPELAQTNKTYNFLEKSVIAMSNDTRNGDSVYIIYDIAKINQATSVASEYYLVYNFEGDVKTVLRLSLNLGLLNSADQAVQEEYNRGIMAYAMELYAKDLSQKYN